MAVIVRYFADLWGFSKALVERILYFVSYRLYRLFFKGAAYPVSTASKSKIRPIVKKIISFIAMFFSLAFIPFIFFIDLFTKSRQTTSGFRINFQSKQKVIVFFGAIDWHFRFQRPQQLARGFSQIGYSVLFVNPTIKPANVRVGFEYESQEGIVILTLKSRNVSKERYIGVETISDELGLAFAQFIEIQISNRFQRGSILVAQQPGWWPILKHLQGNHLVYDCLDLHSGFEEKLSTLHTLEKEMTASADTIVSTSETLAGLIGKDSRRRISVVQNGVDVDHFIRKLNEVDPNEKPLQVGYFGAISHWFDFDLIDFCARRNPDIIFNLIGEVTHIPVIEHLKHLPNVRFFGEVPYGELVEIIQDWKVGLIPFVINPLINATNPVKMYEYAALGLPIVSTKIPDVIQASLQSNGIFVSSGKFEFEENLKRALGVELTIKKNLQSWAGKNSWRNRVTSFESLFLELPRVSVIVLMWNNGIMTLNCLKSVVEMSDYPNLEIIVVDNGSIAGEREIVKNWITLRAEYQIKYIQNAENLGFAAGNNVGLRAASGDYLVILNNDTLVSPGWIWRALKHFYRNQSLGILGPSTNNCGNEGRVALRQNPQDWLMEVVPRFNFRIPKLLKVNTVAFFCVFIPRMVYETVGELCEEFGMGYFEDDDYCRRIQSKSLDVGIARDVFIYHEMGASFGKLEESERQKMFDVNRELYESKWGKWMPHTYATDNDQF